MEANHSSLRHAVRLTLGLLLCASLLWSAQPATADTLPVSVTPCPNGQNGVVVGGAPACLTGVGNCPPGQNGILVQGIALCVDAVSIQGCAPNEIGVDANGDVGCHTVDRCDSGVPPTQVGVVVDQGSSDEGLCGGACDGNLMDPAEIGIVVNGLRLCQPTPTVTPCPPNTVGEVINDNPECAHICSGKYVGFILNQDRHCYEKPYTDCPAGQVGANLDAGPNLCQPFPSPPMPCEAGHAGVIIGATRLCVPVPAVQPCTDGKTGVMIDSNKVCV